MTPAQLAKQAAAILERAEFGNAELGEIERARRWLVEAAGMGWQDVSTAPRDGSWFLTYVPDKRTDFQSFDFAQFDAELDEFSKVGCGWHWVTHWMPLPAPPDGAL